MRARIRYGVLLTMVAAATAACSSLLGDFDASGTGDDGGAGDDATSGTDAQPGNDAPIGPTSDAPTNSGDTGGGGGTDACAGGACSDVACPTNETACGASCFDLTSSGAHCGTCAHDCGGSTCLNSACQPQALVSGVDAPTGFAIDTTSIYFIVDDILKSCALTGCAGGSTQIATYSQMNMVEVANGNVAFVGTANVGNHPSPALYACPVTGCATTPPVIASTGEGAGVFLQLAAVGPDLYYIFEYSAGTLHTSELNRCVGLTSTGSGCASSITIESYEAPPIAADAKNLYFGNILEDSGAQTGVGACPNSAPCTSPKTLTGDDEPPIPTLMSVFGGTVYFVGPRDIGTGGSLYSCATTGCAQSTSLDTVDFPITSLVVDASGIYFTGTSGSSSAVYTCPLSGCGTAGPKAIATAQASPGMLRTDAKFVYWVDLGADAGTGGASIQRVAK